MIIHHDFKSYPPMNKNIFLPPTRDIAWVQIPKCGTTTMRSLWNWELQGSRVDKFRHIKRLVILRDPIQRWRSAIAEAIFPKGKGDYEKRFGEIDIFSGESDRHLYSQCHYAEGVDTNNAVFIRLEELNEKLPLVLDIKEVPHLRKTTAENKKDVMEFIDGRFTGTLVSKIMYYYRHDFELIEYLEGKFI